MISPMELYEAYATRLALAERSPSFENSVDCRIGHEPFAHLLANDENGCWSFESWQAWVSAVNAEEARVAAGTSTPCA